MINDPTKPATDCVNYNCLLAEIEQLRKTNRRLHRRVQIDENAPLFARGQKWGYSQGVKKTEERLTKKFEKELADYKNATRKEMRRLRDLTNVIGEPEDELVGQGIPQRGLYDPVRWAEGLIEQLPESHEGRWSWLVCYGLKATANELRRKDNRDYVWVKERGRFFDTDHLPNDMNQGRASTLNKQTAALPYAPPAGWNH